MKTKLVMALLLMAACWIGIPRTYGSGDWGDLHFCGYRLIGPDGSGLFGSGMCDYSDSYCDDNGNWVASSCVLYIKPCE